MDSTKRFTNRVEYYAKYRPSYPKAAIDFLYDQFGLTREAIFADVGSGTGILTKLLLERGNTVYAVEPNPEMRHAAEEQLKPYSTFHSIPGTAEQTGVADHSVDLIVCAQAFHWFNRELTGREFHRILRQAGYAALMWNEPDTTADSFSERFEGLGKQYGKDYDKLYHRNFKEEDFKDFFHNGLCHKVTFDNEQQLDYDGLRGRLLSSSYIPLPGNAAYEPLLQSLNELYETYQTDGKVSIRYKTNLFYGQVG